MKKLNAWVETVLLGMGAGAVSVGVGLIYFPAGIIAAGTFAILAGILMAKGEVSNGK